MAAAARVYGVPEYYFTAATPQEYMARRIGDLSPEEAAALSTLPARLDWVVAHLEAAFPQEFSVLQLLRALGLAPQDLDADRTGQATPGEGFIEDFAMATGANPDFLKHGRQGSRGDAVDYGAALAKARRLGMSERDLLEAIDSWQLRMRR